MLRDLIRRAQQSSAEIAAIRAALIAGEQSGMSDKTVEGIWEEAQQRYRAKHG